MVVSVNGITPQTTEDIIKQIKTSSSVQLELNRSGSIQQVTMAPKDGKVGMYIGYNEFHLNENFLIKKG